MTISDYKQYFIKILKDMELNFISFRLVQQRMNQEGIAAGQGWEKTYEKYENFFSSLENHTSLSGDETLLIAEQTYNKLVDILQSIRNFNNKAIYAFNVPSNILSQLISTLTTTIQNPDSLTKSFIDIYPLTASEDILLKARNKNLPLILTEGKFNPFTYFSMSTVLETNKKRDLDSSEIQSYIDPQLSDKFSGFFAYKTQLSQSSDFLYIDLTNNLLLLVIDFDIINSLNKADEVVSKYIAFFAKKMKLNARSTMFQPIIFDDKIQKLYDDKTDNSIVTALNHRTVQKSNRHEKTASRLDLRDDIYHSAGTKAVGNTLDMRYITVELSPIKNTDFFLTLTIPGSFRPTNYQNRIIAGNCQSLDNITYLLDKVI